MSSKRKTIKRIVSDCMTILTVIAIFVFSISCIVFIIFTFISSPASAATEKSAADKFQEAVQYASTLKNTVSIEEKNIKAGSFKLEPGKTFSDPKTQKSWYTDNPTQTNYYTQDNVHNMEKAAIAASTKDEDYKDANGNPVPTPGKTVTESFKTRPVFKISQNEEYIKNSKLVETNASNVVMGESNKHINCEKKKMAACKIIQVEKTCNEEVRTIRRVCEKVASVTTYLRDVAYPNCASGMVTRAYLGPCPAGYSQIASSDMIQYESHDDVRICHKMPNQGESSECFSGYLIYSDMQMHQNSGQALVPKKTHGRLRFTDFQEGPMVVTIVNLTTGQTIYNRGAFSNGQVVELPYSETQDQYFQFDWPPCGGYWCGGIGVGVMALYFDRIYKERVANAPVWQELPCHDI